MKANLGRWKMLVDGRLAWRRNARYELPGGVLPNTMVGWQPPAASGNSAAFLNARCLIVVLIVTLVGCATPEPRAIQTPEAQFAGGTWWAIDEEMDAAALAATGPARNYARGYMEN